MLASELLELSTEWIIWKYYYIANNTPFNPAKICPMIFHHFIVVWELIGVEDLDSIEITISPEIFAYVLKWDSNRLGSDLENLFDRGAILIQQYMKM